MRKQIIVHYSVCLFFMIAVFASGAWQKKPVASAKTVTAPAFTYKIINAAGGTFGYDICQDAHLLIHQPSVPALPGNAGFKAKAGAEKVAGLVMKKINKGEMPPTVSLAEMKKLNAL